MKNKILLLSLSAVSLIWLAGCASDGGTVNNKVTVRLPPMPPGFDAKKQKALVTKQNSLAARLDNRAAFVPASSVVAGFPPIRLIAFGDMLLAGAEQQPNHATTMFTRETVTGGPNNVIAEYGCNTGGEVQWVAAGVSKAYPMLFIFALDRDCGAGFMPASAPEPTVGTGRQVVIDGVTNWVLRLPDIWPTPRFILRKVK